MNLDIKLYHVYEWFFSCFHLHSLLFLKSPIDFIIYSAQFGNLIEFFYRSLAILWISSPPHKACTLVFIPFHSLHFSYLSVFVYSIPSV